MQVLSGHIEQDKFPSMKFESIEARDPELAAASAINGDGDFLLVLRVGDNYQLDLVTQTGALLPIVREDGNPVVLRICTEESPLTTPPLERMCGPSVNCVTAEMGLRQCQDDAEARCRESRDALQSCKLEQERQCEAAAKELDNCRQENNGDCQREQVALEECGKEFRCEELEPKALVECTELCDDFEARRVQVCEDQNICEDLKATWLNFPTEIGCEAGP